MSITETDYIEKQKPNLKIKMFVMQRVLKKPLASGVSSYSLRKTYRCEIWIDIEDQREARTPLQLLLTNPPKIPHRMNEKKKIPLIAGVTYKALF